MRLVGKILKESRISKDISLMIIASDLKIPIDVLNDIENDVMVSYLDKVYLTAHVRTYANYLNLDADELVKSYKNEISFKNKNVLKEFPKPVSNNYFLLLSKGTSLASFVFIMVAFYFFFIRTNDLQPNYTMTPDLSQEMISEIESIDLKTFVNENIDNDFAEISYPNFEYKELKKAYSANTAIASTPKITTINNLKNNVTLKFLESTWIQIRNNDDDIILSKLMKNNDEYTYSINDNFILTTGNAGNILVYIGGDPKGKLGKKGEVIESLNLSSKFN